MWSILGYLRELLTITEATQRNTADIKELSKELKQLAAEVQQLRSEVRRLAETETHEREKLLLKLQNALLRFERRLPPPRSGEKGRG